jgi:hypothetical protein
MAMAGTLTPLVRMTREARGNPRVYRANTAGVAIGFQNPRPPTSSSIGVNLVEHYLYVLKAMLDRYLKT